MRKHFWIRALFVLIAIGLLAGSIGGAFRAGWWQGYQVGQAAESEEGATPYWGPRGMPFGYGPLGPRTVGYRPFGLLRALFTFVLLLFLFGLIAKAFGFWAWGRAWKTMGKGWRDDWHKAWSHHGHWPHGRPHAPHGPMPPWCCADSASDDSESDDEEPVEEQVAKVKPDADATEGER